MATLRPTVLLLALVVAASFALRLTGLAKLQPHLQEADPGMVVQVELFRQGLDPDPVEHKAALAYPTLIARGVALLPEAGVPASTPPDERLERELEAASADVVRTRAAVALLASLLAPLTWLLARRFLSPAGAWTAASLVAVSVLHLLFSQQARPHGAHATVALAAVLANVRLARDPTRANLALSSLACALALSVLHTGLFTLPPLLVAWWLGRRGGDRKLSPWLAAAAILPSAAAVALFYPRAPRMEENDSVIELGGHTLRFDKLDGSGFRTVLELLGTYEPALLAAAAIGAGVALSAWLRGGRRTSPEAWVASAYAVPYFVALGIFGETFDRFLLPLLPFLACFAGRLVDAAAALCGARARAFAACAASVAVLAGPAFVTSRYVTVRSAPDTFEQAASWISERVEPGGETVLLGPRITLPLFHDRASLQLAKDDLATRRRPWIRRQLEREAPPDIEAAIESQARGLYVLPGAPPKLMHLSSPQADERIEHYLSLSKPRFIVLEVSKLTSNFPGLAALRATAAARGDLVATFRGEGEGDCLEPPIDYQDIPSFASRILRASAFGPCLEIYRLR